MTHALASRRVVLASLAAAVAIAATAACGTSAPPPATDPSYKLLTEPGTRAPADDLERAILKQLSGLTADQQATIGGRTIVAGAPYSAASGRTCRSVSVNAGANAPARDHLACKIGEAWSFVPDVVRRPAKTSGDKP